MGAKGWSTPLGAVAVGLIIGSAAWLHAASLQEIIDSAAPGMTVEVPAGNYQGPIAIAKPLNLHATGRVTVRGDGKGNVITVQADHVTIDGLHICHSGKNLDQDHAGIFVTGSFVTLSKNHLEDCLHGIYLKKVTDCRIIGNQIQGDQEEQEASLVTTEALLKPDSSETCTVNRMQGARGNGIHLWNSERIVVRDNQISAMRDGVYFSFTHHSQVTGNIIRRVRFGLHYMYSDYNYFEGNQFLENTAGASIMYSKGLLVRRNVFTASVGHRGYGLALTAMDATRIEGNEISGNSTGIHMQLCHNNMFLSNKIARGGVGIRLAASSDGNVFSANRIVENLYPLEIDGSPGENQWALNSVGNQWGNGTEIDFNGDGLGELPHRETDLLGNLRRPFPLAALLSGSPALELARLAQQYTVLPGIAAIVDPAPLTSGYCLNHPGTADVP